MKVGVSAIGGVPVPSYAWSRRRIFRDWVRGQAVPAVLPHKTGADPGI